MNKPDKKNRPEKPFFRDRDFFVGVFGRNVFAVGGYVRDLILDTGKTDADNVDILITHTPLEDIIAALKFSGRVDLIGKSFGIIKFIKDGRTFDIALPRTDKPKQTRTRKHKDFIVSSDPAIPVEKDLERRDFRCNSIALRLSDGAIIDPFHGRKDISDRIIRMTNPEAFPEDPLRVLRAARFASVLGFAVDPEVYSISQNIDLSGLSVERINEEMYRILLESPLPSVGLEELFRLSALRQLFPELYRLSLSIQDALFHPEKDRYGHHTVWQHTKITVDQARRLADEFDLGKGEKLALLLAALFHDVGKAATARWEFKRGRMVITNYGHDISSEKTARDVFDRCKIHSWMGFDLKKTALSLIKTHHRASELWQNRDSVTKKAFNRLAADVQGEIELVVLLDAADRAGRDEKPAKGLDREGLWLLNKFKEMNVSKKTIQPLILGRDLIKMGIEPGPPMGKILKKLYQLQLDGEFETHTAGLKIARKIILESKKSQSL